MKKLTLALIAVSSILISACSKQTFVVQDDYSRRPAEEQRQDFFVYGIAQEKTIYVDEICGRNRLSRVEVEQTAVDVVLSIITFGIYSPRDARVYCSR